MPKDKSRVNDVSLRGAIGDAAISIQPFLQGIATPSARNDIPLDIYFLENYRGSTIIPPMNGKTRSKKRKLRRLLNKVSIEKLITLKLRSYLNQSNELNNESLYPHVISAVEKALIKSVLEKTNNNQIKSAGILGINRNTLRKKIVDLKIKI
jgi:Fis family transcriptional regulator, factor for inversion stimulation protein